MSSFGSLIAVNSRRGMVIKRCNNEVIFNSFFFYNIVTPKGYIRVDLFVWCIFMKRRKNEYTTIKLPSALLEKVDNFVDDHPEYTSRTDLVKEALRRYFNAD